MSGIRLYSFSEGDRSEYLANYLLSGLGLVTVDIGHPVPKGIRESNPDFFKDQNSKETAQQKHVNNFPTELITR